MKIKKIVVSSLLFSFLGLGIVGCNKEVIKKQNQIENENVGQTKALANSYGICTDGSILIFNTIEDFDRLSSIPQTMTQEQEEEYWQGLINEINNLSFPKFKQTKQYLGWLIKGTQENYPSMLLNFLNKDGAVQLGNNIYRLDFDSELCYVISANDKATAYADLVSGNTGNKSVRMFTWYQEVVDIVENRFVKESAAPTAKRVEKMPMGSELNFLLNANWNNQTADVTIQGKKFAGVLKSRYRWACLFWDFYAKVELKETSSELVVDSQGNISGGGVSNANVPVRLLWQRKYKKKNSTEHGFQVCSNGGTGVAIAQSYQGGKALSKYIIGATAQAYVNGVWQVMNFNIPYYNVNGTLYQTGIRYGY
jgi:hypothetical protein